MRILFFLFLAFLMACSPMSKRRLTRTLQETETNFQNHTGFVLYDPVKKKTLINYNGDQYFTPASNTKILTFFTSLLVLPDSIPGLHYVRTGDSLVFWGTGDPSLLYDAIAGNDRILSFLKAQQEQLYMATGNFQTTALGPGWAWSDYNYAYSAERSAMPVYGNTFTIKLIPGESLVVNPTYFQKQVLPGDSLSKSAVIREIGSNRTVFSPGKELETRAWKIPYRSDDWVVANLLADTLKRNVIPIRQFPAPNSPSVVYSVPADSLYKVMMQESDNFIAEQLLLMCAGVLSDTLKPEVAIDYMQRNHFRDFPDKLVWVDGSGLSRYNLFTPRSIVKLWDKIYVLVDRDRLFSLLASGGKSGTLRNHYANDTPYVYGKTGTLSNNHALSGYLITKKGETLIFSFMNNNYTVPVSAVRMQMQKILKQIHDNY
jgi:serine-type D-Ala-D-Ala carboxypeptidase/endopeptidase (penicillin-binding protein 4)